MGKTNKTFQNSSQTAGTLYFIPVWKVLIFIDGLCQQKTSYAPGDSHTLYSCVPVPGRRAVLLVRAARGPHSSSATHQRPALQQFCLGGGQFNQLVCDRSLLICSMMLPLPSWHLLRWELYWAARWICTLTVKMLPAVDGKQQNFLLDLGWTFKENCWMSVIISIIISVHKLRWRSCWIICSMWHCYIDLVILLSV